MEENNIPQIDLSIEGIGKGVDNGNNDPIENEKVITDSEKTSTIEEDDDDTDGNQISVNDKIAPIIMLFGPRSSGKTMALIRLSRYLRTLDYAIDTDFTFRSTPDYHDKCEKFKDAINTDTALPGTSYTDFLLLQVSKNGRTICQFLEAPGEHYFDPSNISANNFPPYMTKIIHALPNRKIWVFIAETHWKVSPKTRHAYINRIRSCKNSLINKKDCCVILYNKIDQDDTLIKNGTILTHAADIKMRNEYSGLADVFKNTHPITSLYRSFNYKFVPFCTGYYSKSGNGLSFTESNDKYPKLLWEVLYKCIRG